MDKSEIRKRNMEEQPAPTQTELEKLFDSYFRLCNGKSEAFGILIKAIKFVRWSKFSLKPKEDNK